MRYKAVVLAAVFILGPAHAAAESGDDDNPPSEWRYDEWDTNNDGRIAEEEFYAGFSDSGLFDDWDANEDGFLLQDELGNALYDYWDIDDDGYIEKDEIEERGSRD